MIGEPAIHFKDAEVLRLINTSSVYNVDGTMTKVQPDNDGLLAITRAAELQTLSIRRDLQYSMFSGNSTIETFNEFQYFTGLEIIGQNMFENCVNLREITIPVCKTTELGRYLVNNTKVTRFIVPEGYTIINMIRTGEGAPFELVDLPSTVVTIPTFMWNYDCNVFICRAIVPPTLSWGRGDVLTVYVPDASVNAYKTATNWSSKASVIRPLSEYVDSKI
jgi:hypothetical protein